VQKQQSQDQERKGNIQKQSQFYQQQQQFLDQKQIKNDEEKSLPKPITAQDEVELMNQLKLESISPSKNTSYPQLTNMKFTHDT